MRGFSKYVRITTTSASALVRAMRGEALGVGERGSFVVDRARADDGEEPSLVAAVDHVPDRHTRAPHDGGRPPRRRKPALQGARRLEPRERLQVPVLEGLVHGLLRGARQRAARDPH